MSQLNKLRWQCRRGLKELDYLLVNYLEYQYPTASVAEQQNFSRLLELEDDVLQAYLLGDSLVEDAGLAEVVRAVRQGLQTNMAAPIDAL
ncbi:succinate dehydrogenase assembly factor 2 [Methylomonas paludis]|uniref:FAD assembly factor SdhE n=1 Tax=Methylomonas paludis TaxID=1173101 RepID=A0A975MQG6_9GAMM|nr:succinate dehydrogenase assembly factor 2 [Methylomonas paludis]QWF72163.1 succinate dehydrogenase assembly factor 2 [Methylomonas paludis]